MTAKLLQTLVTATVLVSAAGGSALDAQARRTPPLVPPPIESVVGYVESPQVAANAPGRSGRTAVSDVLHHLPWSEPAR